VTLDIAIQLLKSLVLRTDGTSALEDVHFAEMEGIREESTLLLRNFYEVLKISKNYEPSARFNCTLDKEKERARI
jgi:hypothetical protein